SPTAFVLLGVIWRDILFGACWLLPAGLVYAAARSARTLRLPIQLIALLLFAFGVLRRPNALGAAPILAAYLVWPSHFNWRRAALAYVPIPVACFALVQVVYY